MSTTPSTRAAARADKFNRGVMEDEMLLARARSGDADAVARIFAVHGESLYRLAYRLLGSQSDAEDVVQEVFAALPGALERYDESGRAVGWLRRVTVRLALMRRRSTRRAVEHLSRWADRNNSQCASATDPSLEWLPFHLALDDALQRLPEALRVVFLLREVEGYSHREIADALGVSESSSKVRLHRAMKQLQRLLREWI